MQRQCWVCGRENWHGATPLGGDAERPPHEYRGSCRRRCGAVESETAHERGTKLAQTPLVVYRRLVEWWATRAPIHEHTNIEVRVDTISVPLDTSASKKRAAIAPAAKLRSEPWEGK